MKMSGTKIKLSHFEHVFGTLDNIPTTFMHAPPALLHSARQVFFDYWRFFLTDFWGVSLFIFWTGLFSDRFGL
jgi:hypothetical protein